MSLRIIVGPETMCVTRQGLHSETVALTEQDDPTRVREIASDLWKTIRPLVSSVVWRRHRSRMALQRRLTSQIEHHCPGPYYPGPRPDLIAVRPWRVANYGEWCSLPHGVVSRLLRTKNTAPRLPGAAQSAGVVSPPSAPALDHTSTSLDIAEYTRAMVRKDQETDQ